MDFPLAPVKKMLRKTHMRIGKNAVLEFAKLLEEISTDISYEAVRIAMSEKRKTVSSKDIKLARKRII